MPVPGISVSVCVKVTQSATLCSVLELASDYRQYQKWTLVIHSVTQAATSVGVGFALPIAASADGVGIRRVGSGDMLAGAGTALA
jgi:hypothetical protein